jgi:hypothetical protein
MPNGRKDDADHFLIIPQRIPQRRMRQKDDTHKLKDAEGVRRIGSSCPPYEEGVNVLNEKYFPCLHTLNQML